jgi:hypothetical protein
MEEGATAKELLPEAQGRTAPGVGLGGADGDPVRAEGRYRWVVERTLSWLDRFRRLKIRYEHPLLY